MPQRVAGVELERAAQLTLGLGPLPVVVLDEAERSVRLGQVGIDLQGPDGRLGRPRPHDRRWLRAEQDRPELIVGVGESSIRRCVGRIGPDRGLEMLDSRPQ